MLQSGNDPYRIIREIQSLGPVEIEVSVEKLPGLSDINPEYCYFSWNILLDAAVEESEITEIFVWVVDDCDLTIERLDTNAINQDSGEDIVEEMLSSTADVLESKSPGVPESETLTTPESATKHKANAEGSSIRVGIDKVDEMINMVGELVITQSMLSQLGEDFSMEGIEKLKNGLSQLERNTRELQESVMRIRMLPISFAFNRFPRMIRDLSNKLGKRVELKMSGEQTELDKTVMEKIGDPLVHLVRNSMDHGLEQPDVRIANGKSETGLLHLNAYHKGGSIIIEITDDGAGLNRDKIRSKAIQNGLITEFESLTNERIYDLIFQPGFSTADQVSDVSGRGVGMDVVRRNIRELGGAVDIKSTPGEGSTITIRLPLTLAIMDGQLVRVGEEIYIIPLVSIIESLQVKQQNVKSIADRVEVYKLRDEYINITRLYQLFELKPDTEDINNGLLVVVEGDGTRVGLYVDELLGQQQVVIKSLEANYKRIDGVSGATILGDGTVAMILDVSGVITISKNQPGGTVERVA
jgi:two-component system chemotaxis sensor kinase CheA